MKSKFSKTVDFILTRTAIFAAAFVWARYYIDNVWTTLFAAAIITVTLNVILALVFGARNRGKALRAGEYSHMREISNQFLLSNTAQNLEFFAEVFKKGEDCDVTVMHEAVAATKDGRTVLVFPSFSPLPLNRQNVIEYARFAAQMGANEIAVLCLSTEKGLAAFCDTLPDFKIKIYDPVKTYALLKSYKTFPEITRRMAAPKKPCFKTLVGTALSRARTKGYITGGIFLFVMSFITPYRLYYLIAASALFLVGLLSYFNRKYNTGISKNMRII